MIKRRVDNTKENESRSVQVKVDLYRDIDGFDREGLWINRFLMDTLFEDLCV